MTSEVAEEVAAARDKSDAPDDPSQIEEKDVATQQTQL